MRTKTSTKNQPTQPQSEIFGILLGLYALALTGYLIGSFFPADRVWGFSIMAYLPAWALAALLAGAVVAGVAGEFAYRKYLAVETDRQSGYTMAALFAAVLLLTGFYFLRARTYFFGDGYTLLNLLATGNPLIEKERQLVESLVHVWLYRAIGGGSEHDAATAYQIISIAAGVIYLAAAALFSRSLFRGATDRLLLFVGLVSGGWMLLYFGYAENYSMFVLLITVYTLTGILVMNGRVGRWTIGVLQVALFGFHIFGVTLIPATLYLLLHDTRPARWFEKQPTALRLGLAGSVIIILIAGFAYALTGDLFFRIALVPLVNSPFVPEHYTLFSFSHLADYVNLLFIVLPGLLLLLFGFVRLPLRKMAAQSIYRWLALAAAGPLGAAFIFDPKLGMPRDWDLFSFCGVLLAVLLLFSLISHRDKARAGLIVLLAALLGFTGLSARAIWLATPEIGIAHFRDYLYLDKVKNRNGWIFLTNYYDSIGDSTASAAALVDWKANFPEEKLMAEANEAYYQRRDPAAAEALLRRILLINPSYSDAYSFLGFLYLQKGQYDSALAEIRLADALSPNRPNNLNNMAQAYYGKGEYDKAEEILQNAATFDSAGYAAQYNLARFYSTQRDFAGYLKYLRDAATHPDAPPQIVEELIVVYLRAGQTGRARQIYCSAPAVRADTTFLPKASAQVPGIDTLLRCP